MENLKFRRQFVLSNSEIAILDGWKNHRVSNPVEDFYLSSHPDLDVIKVSGASKDLLLLGYIIDPYNPERNSESILFHLAKFEHFDEIVAASFNLGGRFVIIVSDISGIKIFNDAMAFREVYYVCKSQVTACGSTPDILMQIFGLHQDMDPELQQFYKSKAFNSPERIWIGDKTPIEGVKHLLPNHYLDLVPGTCIRFWPIVKMKRISIKPAIELMSDILKGTYKAASLRFTIHQGLTSGWDTRLLLAASHNFCKDIHYFFIRGFKGDEIKKGSVDYHISKEIAQKFDLDHEIIETDNIRANEDFVRTYYANNLFARPKLLSVFYHAYLNNYENTITISGTGGNEILRLLRIAGRNDCSSFSIAKIWNYESFPFIKNNIELWFRSNYSLKKTNFKMIDIFFWEQMFANWGSLSGSEQDIVRDELRPFNNRAFISAYILLLDRYRYPDYPKGHIRIIKKLWPELLSFDMDINNYKLKKVLRRLGIEIITVRLLKNIRKNLISIQ